MTLTQRWQHWATAEAQGLWAGARGGMLSAASVAYRLGVRAHRASYRQPWRRAYRAPCTVISVGNLTVGGTGKTPMTLLLAQRCLQAGQQVAVALRGYRTPGDAGKSDEATWYSRRLPDVSVIAAADRAGACQQLLAQQDIDVLILDDGYQHWAMARDLDVVLVDATQPWGNGHLLPRGSLREPPSALQRAGLVVLTHMEGVTNPHKSALVQAQIGHWAVGTPQVRASHRATEVYQLDPTHTSATTERPQALGGRRLVAASGIAQPAHFAALLTQLGVHIVSHLQYRDHHPYTAHDWQSMLTCAQSQKADGIIVTEKDAVRLAPALDASTDVPVWVLKIDIHIEEEDEATFTHVINRYLAR